MTRGVRRLLDAGLAPVKLNAVLIRGYNDDEAVELAALARSLGVEMRFIEYMPLDSARAWDASRWVSAAETRAAVQAVFPLSPCRDDPTSTSRTFRFADLDQSSPARVGFIAPISSTFCGACSRIRVSSDGQIHPCLFSAEEWDLRSPMRAGASDEDLADLLIDAAGSKQAGHAISSSNFVPPERPMSAIGASTCSLARAGRGGSKEGSIRTRRRPARSLRLGRVGDRAGAQVRGEPRLPAPGGREAAQPPSHAIAPATVSTVGRDVPRARRARPAPGRRAG